MARALLKHCDIQSLVHSRSYIDDRGQVADLDPAKVVDNATKNASPALTQKVIVGLKFLSDPPSQEDATEQQFWMRQEEEQAAQP